MTTESIACESLDGLALEAELDAPETPGALLVLCHPHPQMGGTMRAPLLLALSDALVAKGWAVLRFNFRGIGKSQGDSGTRIDEVADARGAIDTGRARLPGLPFAIAGWSFGAAVAVRAATEVTDLAACVGIAPAVRERPGTTAGLPDPGVIELGIPTLFVCGSNDELVSEEDARAWVEQVPAARLLVLKGANHFFWGKYEDLSARVIGFLNECLG
ncbi:MAG: alpha/beta hydrolase [Actinomycetota bacterium]